LEKGKITVLSSVTTYFNSSKYYTTRRNDNFLSNVAKIGRKKTKLRNRKKVLKAKTTISDVDKMVIDKVLTMDFMSSEDEKEDSRFNH